MKLKRTMPARLVTPDPTSSSKFPSLTFEIGKIKWKIKTTKKTTVRGEGRFPLWNLLSARQDSHISMHFLLPYSLFSMLRATKCSIPESRRPRLVFCWHELVGCTHASQRRDGRIEELLRLALRHRVFRVSESGIFPPLTWWQMTANKDFILRLIVPFASEVMIGFTLDAKYSRLANDWRMTPSALWIPQC